MQWTEDMSDSVLMIDNRHRGTFQQGSMACELQTGLQKHERKPGAYYCG